MRGGEYFILNDDYTVTQTDVVTWSHYSRVDRKLDSYQFEKYSLSSVFLGMDHNYGLEGPPLIFETMIFRAGTWNEVLCERYATHEETMLRAQELVHLVESGEINFDD